MGLVIRNGIIVGYRGYDAGTNLKTTSGWYENGNGTDLFGFSGLPGGYRINFDGFFDDVGDYGFWWSSTEFNNYVALVTVTSVTTTREYTGYIYGKGFGYSVRCLRDEIDHTYH